jgi:hypothetical protein|tara:strand:+ start:348 stop:506 length:159 start_codon:yes stop_codon:yes gene_type:complete
MLRANEVRAWKCDVSSLPHARKEEGRPHRMLRLIGKLRFFEENSGQSLYLQR